MCSILPPIRGQRHGGSTWNPESCLPCSPPLARLGSCFLCCWSLRLLLLQEGPPPGPQDSSGCMSDVSRLQKLHKYPENPPLILPQTGSNGTHSSVCMDWVFSGVLWVGVGTRASAEGVSGVCRKHSSGQLRGRAPPLQPCL